MSENITTPAKSRSARRGRGPAGLLTVGDYVGKAAADAAQAVRRAGLRPGLDRSFGCAAELAGLVVEQEPAAGEQIARNAMITLYVAAPGQVPVDAPGELPSEDNVRHPPLSAPEAPPSRPPVAVSYRAGDARSRKRRVVRDIAPTFASAPPPVPTTAGGLSEQQQTAELAVCAAAHESDISIGVWRGEAHEPAEDPRPVHEYGTEEEFVVRADEVFAGRRGDAAPWRRVYPRTVAGSTLRAITARATRHPVIALSTCVVLAAWLALAVTSAQTDRRAEARTPSLAARGSGVDASPTRATGSEAPRALHPSTAQVRVPRRPPSHRPPVTRAVRERARTPPAHTVPVSPPRQSSLPAESRAAVPQPRSGGPFSP
jgi:hypothetical protein